MYGTPHWPTLLYILPHHSSLQLVALIKRMACLNFINVAKTTRRHTHLVSMLLFSSQYKNKQLCNTDYRSYLLFRKMLKEAQPPSPTFQSRCTLRTIQLTFSTRALANSELSFVFSCLRLPYQYQHSLVIAFSFTQPLSKHVETEHKLYYSYTF